MSAFQRSRRKYFTTTCWASLGDSSIQEPSRRLVVLHANQAARPRQPPPGLLTRTSPLPTHHHPRWPLPGGWRQVHYSPANRDSFAAARRAFPSSCRASLPHRTPRVSPTRSSSSYPSARFSSSQNASNSYGPPYPSQYSNGGTGGGGGGGGDFALYSLLLRRAAMAMGMAYAWTEYVVDMTLCEGPSMTPTIHPYGEIVVMDKWNPRRFGLRDGDDGDVRARRARERQRAFEKEQREKQRQQRAGSQSSASHGDVMICWHEPVLASLSELTKAVTYREMWRHVRSPISVGDVLVVQHPRRKGTVCKRVVGLPGDQILLGAGASYVSPSSSLYRSSSRRVRGDPNGRQLLVVPDGHVWLEGDNPANSSDSRHYGPIPAALIVGRVLFRAWPIRGNAWMVRARRPDDMHGYVLASTTVVLPAGYDGQPILKRIAHDAVAASSASSSNEASE